jgi:hypothetical protein
MSGAISQRSFESEPLAGGRTRFTQTAFFEPRGLFGFVYWYLVVPFHGLIFNGMASEIVRIAEGTTA